MSNLHVTRPQPDPTDAIRPFHIHVPDDAPPDLRERLASRWTDFDTGGHFAALETPDLLVGDIRAFFRTLRD